MASGRLAVEYVLPLRSDHDAGLAELTGYLHQLCHWVDVTVVDGSPRSLFDRHAAAWGSVLRHIPPDPALWCANGKVSGVLTGLRQARHEHVVIADDDVRYDLAALAAIVALLARVDLVRPQNYFEPLPWHARWDTGRVLFNRGTGADYPGTLAVRRSRFLAMGGYDGNALFENLELIRTVRAAGGREASPLGLYVRRLPPDVGRFWRQRVRQAYDDFAQPVRQGAFLCVLPWLAVATIRRRPASVAAAAVAVVAVAEVGRRRAGGTRVFPASSSLLAAGWVLERAVCGWLALGLRLTRGGVHYAGRRLRMAAHSERALRRALRGRSGP